MQDYQSLFVTSSVIIITTLLTIVGIQLYFTIIEIKRLAKKANSLVEEIEKVGLNLKSGYGEVFGFVSGFKRLLSIVEIFSRRKKTT